VLAAMASVPLVLRSQSRPSEPERAAIPPTTAAPWKIAFQSNHWGGDPPQSFGCIGSSSRAIREGDELDLSARLDAPAYGYLIALNSDGTVQLLNPLKEGDPPSRSAEIGIDSSTSFAFTDGAGLQAFVVVASSKRLPPFAEWTGREGLHQRWGHVVTADLSLGWDFEDGKFKPFSRVSRGDLRRHPEREAPAPLRAVCEYLEKLPEVEAVRAIAFSVQPND
jgi:hypothetical protein